MYTLKLKGMVEYRIKMCAFTVYFYNVKMDYSHGIASLFQAFHNLQQRATTPNTQGIDSGVSFLHIRIKINFISSLKKEIKYVDVDVAFSAPTSQDSNKCVWKEKL